MAPLTPELRTALLRRSGPDGFLPFDRFMEVALYEPSVGYYARAATPFGPGGDFYTAPRVHPVFAATVAARVAAIDEALGRRRPFSVVDLGSGDGRLLAGVARALGRHAGTADLQFVAIDRSPARRAASLELLRAATAGAGSGLAARALAELGPIEGVVVGHELLDAQPARRWRWSGTDWRELGLRVEGDELRPVEAPPAPATVTGGFPRPGPNDAGVVLETSASAEAIVREIGDHLVGGAALLVDFGAEERELQAGHPGGTLAAIRAHRPLPSAWESVGDADLSVFVNFTRVRAAARRAGLTEIAYRGQAEALGAWGFAGALEAALADCTTAEEAVRVRLAAKNLLFGFGTFRVLELAAKASSAALAGLTAAS